MRKLSHRFLPSIMLMVTVLALACSSADVSPGTVAQGPTEAPIPATEQHRSESNERTVAGDADDSRRQQAAGAESANCYSTFDSSDICHAIENGDTEAVRKLVNGGADVNAVTDEGDSMLALAVSPANPDLEIIRILIGAGADANWVDSFGNPILAGAVNSGNAEIVRVLVEAGANPDDRLQAAFRSGDAQRLQILLDAGANPNSVVLGIPLLQMAIDEDDAEMARTLVEAGADVDAAGDFGDRLLIGAIYGGKAEMVRILAGAGADVNGADRDGYTPLTGASYDGNVEIVRILINAGADVNAADANGETPLGVAKREGHSEVIRALSDGGAVESRGKTGPEDGEDPSGNERHESFMENFKSISYEASLAMPDRFTESDGPVTADVSGWMMHNGASQMFARIEMTEPIERSIEVVTRNSFDIYLKDLDEGKWYFIPENSDTDTGPLEDIMQLPFLALAFGVAPAGELEPVEDGYVWKNEDPSWGVIAATYDRAHVLEEIVRADADGQEVLWVRFFDLNEPHDVLPHEKGELLPGNYWEPR